MFLVFIFLVCSITLVSDRLFAEPAPRRRLQRRNFSYFHSGCQGKELVQHCILTIMSLLKVCGFLLLMCLRDLVIVFILFASYQLKILVQSALFFFSLDMPEFLSSLCHINLNMHDFSNLKDVFLFLANSLPCHSVLFSSLFKPFLLQCNIHISCKNLIFLGPPFRLPFHRLPHFYIMLFLHDLMK